MANDKNGSDWIRWVLGIVLVTILPFMASVIWSNDKDGRCRDNEIEDKMNSICDKQNAVNQEILITLASMKTDLVYIKKSVGARPGN